MNEFNLCLSVIKKYKIYKYKERKGIFLMLYFIMYKVIYAGRKI